jgi:hypothetical protein
MAFHKKNYNFKTSSHRDTKPTGTSSLTFDLENEFKVKGQGHTNYWKFAIFITFFPYRTYKTKYPYKDIYMN